MKILPIWRVALVAPAALLLLLLLFVVVLALMGHRWNPHGDAIALVLAFAIVLSVRTVIELWAVSRAVSALVRNPRQRTARNLVSVGAGAAFLLACSAGALVCAVTAGP